MHSLSMNEWFIVQKPLLRESIFGFNAYNHYAIAHAYNAAYAHAQGSDQAY